MSHLRTGVVVSIFTGAPHACLQCAGMVALSQAFLLPPVWLLLLPR